MTACGDVATSVSIVTFSPRTLVLTNESLINAPFKTFIKNARSKFRVDVRDGTLAPQESISLTVIASLDDTTVHRDQMHIVVAEGDNLVVPLSAKGIGTTMFSHEDMTQIDFGTQFTNCPFERKVTLENKGRRSQVLKWINASVKEAMLAQAQVLKRLEKEAAAEAGKSGKKKKDPGMPEGVNPTFTVTPEEIELRPRTAVTFTFRGFSAKKGSVQEKLVCESRVGKDKNAKPVFNTLVKADFIEPLLEFTAPTPLPLSFNYTWERGVPIAVQATPLTMTNRTLLPLHFALRTQTPFSVDCWEHSLPPGESATVRVEFDPGFKGDRQSQRIETRLSVAYQSHPHRDSIPLLGEINFPNLDFEYNVVNFGCVLNDTTKTLLVRVTNCSKVATDFQWAFLEDEDAARAASTSRKPYIPVNQVFDILPIRSKLGAGDSEDVEFIYYGHASRRFKGTVLCEVEGGPEYELTLLGEASTKWVGVSRRRIVSVGVAAGGGGRGATRARAPSD